MHESISQLMPDVSSLPVFVLSYANLFLPEQVRLNPYLSETGLFSLPTFRVFLRSITRRNGSKVCVDPAAPWFLAIVMRVPK